MANMPLTDIGITPRKASQFASKGINPYTIKSKKVISVISCAL